MSNLLYSAALLSQPSPWVELFSMDLTAQGGDIIYWTPGPIGNDPVVFAGNTYVSIPIQADGFEYNGQGPLPTPTLTVSNVNSYAMSLLIGFNDCLGAIVTRMRTFMAFLDGQPQADITATAMPDVFRVERKAHADKTYVQLELAAFTDVQGRQTPFRVVLQGACGRTYRTWDAATEAFVQGQCPYTGDAYFDVSDTAQTDPSKDMCSRKLQGCLNRYGTAPLPTWMFPGASINSF